MQRDRTDLVSRYKMTRVVTNIRAFFRGKDGKLKEYKNRAILLWLLERVLSETKSLLEKGLMD